MVMINGYTEGYSINLLSGYRIAVLDPKVNRKNVFFGTETVVNLITEPIDERHRIDYNLVNVLTGDER